MHMEQLLQPAWATVRHPEAKARRSRTAAEGSPSGSSDVRPRRGLRSSGPGEILRFAQDDVGAQEDVEAQEDEEAQEGVGVLHAGGSLRTPPCPLWQFLRDLCGETL